MQNSAHGANDGVSKIMLALIFLPVVWMKKISSMLDSAVGNRGAGTVAKNTAHSTMTLKRGNGVKMQKTITMHYVVVKSLALKKKTTVRVDTQDTVVVAGKQILSLVECLHWSKQQQKPLSLFSLPQVH
jgi:hypothetical protein